MTAPQAERRTVWLEAACAAVAAVVPFLVAVSRMPLASGWREDLPLVRGLGLVSTWGGAVSSILMQAASLVPTGPLAFRAALMSAAAAGIAGLFLYVFTRRVLWMNAETPVLAPVLAAIAALTAALSPAWQREATSAGGATVAAGIALGAFCLLRDPRDRDVRFALGAGALLAAELTESSATAALLALALSARVPLAGATLTRRAVVLFLAGFVVTAAILVCPLVIRPAAPHGFVELGFSLRQTGWSYAAAASHRPPTALSAWTRELGPLALMLSVAGAVLGLWRQRLRWMVGPTLLFVAADAASPWASSSVVFELLTPLRVLAVAALALTVAVGVQTIAATLLAARVPLARGAAILFVVFDLTLVTMTEEEASFAAERSAASGAEAWADEAIERLPPRAALLTRSRAVAWRIWSERLLQGTRPDLLVIPMPLLGGGSIAAQVLKAEPASMPLLRDVGVLGAPSENALTVLADARNVEVELDPAWDRRIVSHLLADRLWLRFAPEPLGVSDRRLAFAASRAAFARVRASASGETSDVRDADTMGILAANLRAQSTVAAMLGDRDEAVHLLELLADVSRDDPFIADLTQRLATTKASAPGIDVKNLWRD